MYDFFICVYLLFNHTVRAKSIYSYMIDAALYGFLYSALGP